MKIKCLIFFIFLFSTELYAQDWIYTGAGHDGTKDYIRSVYLAKDSQLITIWIKSSIPKIIIEKVKYLNATEKSLVIFNCANSQYAFKQNTIYSNSGTVIQQYKDDYLKWINIIPESLIEGDFLKACELFNK